MLATYLAAAEKMCHMLGQCDGGPLGVDLRSEISLQRSIENEAQMQYTDTRQRLLTAARLGFDRSE